MELPSTRELAIRAAKATDLVVAGLVDLALAQREDSGDEHAARTRRTLAARMAPRVFAFVSLMEEEKRGSPATFTGTCDLKAFATSPDLQMRYGDLARASVPVPTQDREDDWRRFFVHKAGEEALGEAIAAYSQSFPSGDMGHIAGPVTAGLMVVARAQCRRALLERVQELYDRGLWTSQLEAEAEARHRDLLAATETTLAELVPRLDVGFDIGDLFDRLEVNRLLADLNPQPKPR